MTFPKLEEPNPQLFKTFNSWAKLLDDSLFSKLKNEGEAKFISNFDNWLIWISQALFNPHNLLFVRSQNKNNGFYRNPVIQVEPFHLNCFKFAGKLIALAARRRVCTGVSLDRVSLMSLVGKNPSPEDIKDANLEIFNVKEENVNELIQHRFVGSISKQVEFFINGMAEVLGEQMIRMLKLLEPDDLHAILFGMTLGFLEVDDVFLNKVDQQDYDGNGRLMYRYKQIEVDGRNISKWKRCEHLGSGAFGSVYKGLGADGSIFAVKKVSLENKKKGSVQQLEQEINFLCQLSHPNIIKYLGIHKDEFKLCVFLEFAGHGSLIDIFKKYELEESHISSYTKSILEGLKYLHSRDVVHRDIKCANILVGDHGCAKLADFGLAKANVVN